jgi:hypothetical protein
MNKGLTPMGLLGFAFAASEVTVASRDRFEVVAVAGIAVIGARIGPVSASKSAGWAHGGTEN